MRQFRAEEGTEQEIAADTVDLVRVFREILDRARQRPVLDVDEEAVTVAQMIDYVKRRLLMEDRPVSLRRLLHSTHSERALICMFLAMLELVRLQAVLLHQPQQMGDILIRNDAADNHDHIVHLVLSEQVHDSRHNRVVRARKNRKPDDVHVFLHGSAHNHLWRLTQAGVDDLHASVAQSSGNNLCAPVMPVKAGLRDQYTDFLLSGHFLRCVSTGLNTERSRIQQRQEDRPIRWRVPQ